MVHFLLGELSVHLHTHILLHCDNLGATYLAANLPHHSCMRHIELDYHFVCEKFLLVVFVFLTFPQLVNRPIFSLKLFISLVMVSFVLNLSDLARLDRVVFE